VGARPYSTSSGLHGIQKHPYLISFYIDQSETMLRHATFPSTASTSCIPRGYGIKEIHPRVTVKRSGGNGANRSGVTLRRSIPLRLE
jgi:hypothetical protein